MGAVNFASSMQYAICAAVIIFELDDVAVICLRQHVVKLLQAFAFTRGMQSEHAVAVLASKRYDRTGQHDTEFAASV